jgi:ABC-type transport system involved in cytochrome bd biosynthesis fused ATPase/permease subunit
VTVIGAPAELDGPLPAGTRAGTAVVRVGARVRARVPVVTAAAVPAASLTQRATSFFRRPLTLALAALLVACSLQLAVLRHRASRRRRRRSEHRRRTEAA